MKIRFLTSALNEALAMAAIVPPKAVSADCPPGFLFVVRDQVCSIYSRDDTHQLRVNVPFGEVDEDGSFIFPAEKVGALKFLDGWIEITSVTIEDRFFLSYESESGAKQADISTIDPRLMQSLDASLRKAIEGPSLPASLLREGVSMTRPYLAKVGDEKVGAVFQNLQLFDDSTQEWKESNANGFLYAADRSRSCSFYSEKLEGRALAIHGAHLPFLQSFLGRSQGSVTLRQGEGVTYLVNAQSCVLGWAQSIVETRRFNYYSLETDAFVLRADKDLFLKALRYVKAAIDSKRDKIRIQYTPETNTVVLLATEGSAKAVSRPIAVKAISEANQGGFKGAEEGFAANLNINHLLDLVEPLKANQFDLRVAPIGGGPGKKSGFAFRTIDTFFLDENGRQIISKEETDQGKAAECQVTRFMLCRD